MRSIIRASIFGVFGTKANLNASDSLSAVLELINSNDHLSGISFTGALVLFCFFVLIMLFVCFC